MQRHPRLYFSVSSAIVPKPFRMHGGEVTLTISMACRQQLLVRTSDETVRTPALHSFRLRFLMRRSIAQRCGAFDLGLLVLHGQPMILPDIVTQCENNSIGCQGTTFMRSAMYIVGCQGTTFYAVGCQSMSLLCIVVFLSFDVCFSILALAFDELCCA